MYQAPYPARPAAGSAQTVRPLPPAEADLARLFSDPDALVRPVGCACCTKNRDDLYHRFLE